MRAEKQSEGKELMNYKRKAWAAGVQEKSECVKTFSLINFGKPKDPQWLHTLLLVAAFSFVTFLLAEQKKSKRTV